MKYIYKTVFVSLSALFFSASTHANEFWENWDLSISAGYGERSNPLLNADDIKTYINIDIAWYGERFFFDNGDVGYNLYYGENLSLNLIGQLNNERVFFGKTNTDFVSIGSLQVSGDEALSPPPITDEDNETPVSIEYEVADRDHAYEAGVEAIIDGDFGQLQFALLHDISGQHQGQRADMVFSQTHIRQRWLFRPSAGISWKSDGLTDYYFGVTDEESNSIVPRYQASASVSGFAQLLVNYAINKDLFWGLALEYEKLGNEISNSPIVTDDTVTTAYTGLKYRF